MRAPQHRESLPTRYAQEIQSSQWILETIIGSQAHGANMVAINDAEHVAFPCLAEIKRAGESQRRFASFDRYNRSFHLVSFRDRVRVDDPADVARRDIAVEGVDTEARAVGADRNVVSKTSELKLAEGIGRRRRADIHAVAGIEVRIEGGGDVGLVRPNRGRSEIVHA